MSIPPVLGHDRSTLLRITTAVDQSHAWSRECGPVQPPPVKRDARTMTFSSETPGACGYVCSRSPRSSGVPWAHTRPPHGPVLIPEGFAPGIDQAFSNDGDVLLVADVDQRRGPAHLDARHARLDIRIICQVLAAENLHTLVDPQRHALLDEDRAGQVRPGSNVTIPPPFSAARSRPESPWY